VDKHPDGLIRIGNAWKSSFVNLATNKYTVQILHNFMVCCANDNSTSQFVIKTFFQGRIFQLVCSDNPERVVRSALYSFKVVHADKITREFVTSAENYSWYQDDNECRYQRKIDPPVMRFLHCLLYSKKFTTTMMNLTPGRGVDAEFYKNLPNKLEKLFGAKNIQLAKNTKYPF